MKGGVIMEKQPSETNYEKTKIEPKIYVASRADYNSGILHGTWIDANQEADDIYLEIAQMLNKSKQPNAEEWAIHDYEGFGPVEISEFESIKIISALGKGINEHGLAFSHFVQMVGTKDLDDLNNFNDVYIGKWDSLEQYAREMLDDFGLNLDDCVPEFIKPYVHIDIDSFAQDLKNDLFISEDGDGVYVFSF